MKRVLRWAFNGVVAVSLLLCVAACGSWIRSYCAHDSLRWSDAGGKGGVESSGGRWLLWRQRVEGDGGYVYYDGPAGRSVQHATANVLSAGPAGLPFRWEFAGVSFRGGRAMGIRFAYLLVPHWLPALFFLVPVSLVVYPRLRRRTPSPGVCRGCGYDLTGNVSGVCPECGKAIRTASAKGVA